jgi:hypothetical protein
MATPKPPEAEKPPAIPPLYNVVAWNFNEHEFKADTDFDNPGIDEKCVLRAIADGFLRAK